MMDDAANSDPIQPGPALAPRLDRLCGEVKYLRRGLERDFDRREGFLSAMGRLLSFIRDYDDREAWSAFEAQPEFAAHREYFGRCVLRFAWTMESLTHAEMMEKPVHRGPIGPLIGRQTRGQYARMEELTRMVDFARHRSFVMTGCGKLPACLFFLYDRTSVADLLGIDSDAESVSMARELVERWGWSRIRIEQSDAAEISYAPYDLIYWDPFATPRRKIMSRILETACPDVTIILREPFGAGTLLMEPVMPHLDPRFIVTGESERFPGRFMLKHYLLRFAPAS